MSATVMIYLFFLLALIGEVGLDYVNTCNFFQTMPINSDGELYAHRYPLSSYFVKYLRKVISIDMAILGGVFIAKGFIPTVFASIFFFDSGIVMSAGAVLTALLIMVVALYGLVLSGDR